MHSKSLEKQFALRKSPFLPHPVGRKLLRPSPALQQRDGLSNIDQVHTFFYNLPAPFLTGRTGVPPEIFIADVGLNPIGGFSRCLGFGAGLSIGACAAILSALMLSWRETR
jgi:hypothetical protein